MPDRFIDEYKSRNEEAADLFRRLNVCERKGSGIDKVIKLVEEHQLPAPHIRNDSNRTHVTLFAHKSFKSMSTDERVRACYQHACLKFLSNESMNNQCLRERFKLSEGSNSAVSKIIAAALEQGYIKTGKAKSESSKHNVYIPHWG